MGKSNKKFMLLSALGIIMVVDAHAWTTLTLFAEMIPYNSFLMPLFIFISGYFCKIDETTDLLKFVKKKTKKLLLPWVLFLISLFLIELLIKLIKFGHWVLPSEDEILEAAYRLVTDGMPVKLAAPLWFIPTLFFVECLYAVLKKNLLKRKIWNDLSFLIVFFAINMLVVSIAKSVDVSKSPFLHLMKCGFMMPFYQLGQVYKKYLEDRLKNLNHIVVAVTLMIINLIRMMSMSMPGDIQFNDLALLSGFTCSLSITPAISSVIGIWFWITIVEIIEPVLGNDKIMNYVSNNTFWIVAFHLTMFDLLNCILMFVDKNIVHLEGFDYEIFLDGHWYRWEHAEEFRFAYWAVGVIGSLVAKMLFDKVVSIVKKNGFSLVGTELKKAGN